MILFKRSLILAIQAFAHLFISKFCYEMKWGFAIGGIALLSAATIFISPMMIIILPLCVSVSNSAYTLGTQHSMLGYLGLAKGFTTEALLTEIIKTSFVRSIGYSVVFAIIAVVLLCSFSLEYLSGFLSNPPEFIKAEQALFMSGKLPAFVVGFLTFSACSLVYESIYAVPLAAAAYSISPNARGFNGFWGMGYRWKEVLFCRILYLLSVCLFALVLAAIFLSAKQVGIVTHYITSFATGAAPDFETYPVEALALTSLGAQLGFIAFMLFGVYLASPFLHAVRALVFRDKLREHLQTEEAAYEAAKPTPEMLRKAAEKKRADSRKLWKKRMPAPLTVVKE
ncbi:GrpB family protein [Lentibacter algarum]|uniref:GrpB family protein n=1 Tax=Lentibacter algarum TaxID=576131 RepID=UPI001C079A5A|nr:GrpB family protein [Lentibacter algarum]MBU2981689.1 GrpB family protein [Lentibacter algarum]